MSRLDEVRAACDRATFGGDAGGLDAALVLLAGIDADVLLARGQVLHARFFETREEDTAELAAFERAVAAYRALGDARGEGEAVLWTALVHQVIRRDDVTAVPLLERARSLAEQVGDRRTLSYVLRHLGIAANGAGDLDRARALLEESVALRRELDFPAGVAANLVGLAFVAHGQQRSADAVALLDEADALAQQAGASAITAQVAAARSVVAG